MHLDRASLSQAQSSLQGFLLGGVGSLAAWVETHPTHHQGSCPAPHKHATSHVSSCLARSKSGQSKASSLSIKSSQGRWDQLQLCGAEGVSAGQPVSGSAKAEPSGQECKSQSNSQSGRSRDVKGTVKGLAMVGSKVEKTNATLERVVRRPHREQQGCRRQQCHASQRSRRKETKGKRGKQTAHARTTTRTGTRQPRACGLKSNRNLKGHDT